MRYVVAYAEYNRNESHDALVCGVFRDSYATVEAALEAIMDIIRDEAESEISDGGREGNTADGVAEGWIWSRGPRFVAAEHDGIESVYSVCTLPE